MAEAANLCVTIDPELKEQAERVFSFLGISTADAIAMFYRQVVLQHGLPFAGKVPVHDVVDVNKLTEEELDAELEKGYADVLAGRTRDARSVFADLYSYYGI